MNFQSRVFSLLRCFYGPTGSSFFVVAVFLWPNRIIIRINMHREATRTPPWPLGGGVKDENNIFFISLIFYEKNIFLFKHLAEI